MTMPSNFTPRYCTLEPAHVQAFKHPLVDTKPHGFHGGPVLLDPSHEALRHTRSWRPVDYFDSGENFDLTLDGAYVYGGPSYHHFGHVMSEMVHRILPSRSVFDCRRWLFVLARGESTSYESRQPFFRQLLEFCEISPDSVS